MMRPRVRIATLMLLVATAAVAACTIEFKKRRDRFLARAAYHSESESLHRSLEESALKSAKFVRQKFPVMKPMEKGRYPLPLSDAERFPPEKPEDTPDPDEERARKMETLAATSRDQVTWHAAMKAKYERAASHPWLPVAPDQAEPKRVVLVDP